MRYYIATWLAFISVTALAGDQKPKSLKPDLILEYQDDLFEVQADGSYVTTSTHRYKINTEEGKRKAALTKIPYDPDRQSVVVKSGKTNTLGTNYSLDLKTIEDREVGNIENGITNRKNLILPFRALALDSTVEYTYVMKSKPKSISGVFSLSGIYGFGMPELAGRMTVKSKKPLTFKVRDADKALLVTKEGKEGWYTVTAEIKKPIFLNLYGEDSPYVSKELLPRIDISNVATWQELVTPIAEKYEAEITKPLPAEFAQIGTEAAKATTDDAKFNSVMTSLASKMTYVGHWTAEKGRFFPRGHKDVIATKTGDCKDFSTSTAAILRMLGYDAKVALTYRSTPGLQALNEPALENGESTPSGDYFNHAIVAVRMKDGTTRWLEPTTTAPQAEQISADIANAYALVLDAKSQKLEPIPESAPSLSRMNYSYRLIAGETGDLKGDIQIGGADAGMMRLLMKESSEQGDMVLRALVSGDPRVSGTFQPSTTASPTFNANFQFTMERASYKGEKDIYLRLPRFLGFNMLSLASPTRKIPLLIGGKSQFNITTNVTGAQAWDDETSDCLVMTPWFDYKRVVIPTKTGFEIRTEAKLKANHLTLKDMADDEFHLGLSSLSGCGSSIQLKNPADSTRNIATSTMTVDDAWSLTEGINRQKTVNQMNAIRVFDRLLATDKLNHRARIGRARALFDYGYISARDYKREYLRQAIQELDFVLQADPNSIDGLLNRSRIQMRYGQMDHAIRDFAAVKKLAPWDFKVLMLAGDISAMRKDDAATEAWYRHAIRTGKTREEVAQAKFALAWLYTDNKQSEKAIPLREEALVTRSADPWEWHNLAISYKAVKRIDDAIMAEKKALAISDFGAARWNLASYYCERALNAMESGGPTYFTKPENYAKSESDIEEGLRTRETPFCLSTAATFNLRKVFVTKDPALMDRAEGHLRKILMANPTDKSALNKLKIIEGIRNPNVARIPAMEDRPRTAEEILDLVKGTSPGTTLRIDMGVKRSK